VRIEWVNHASYVLHADGFVLWVDPWYEGRVFNHGWGMLIEQDLSPHVLDEVTHIWFSHEHPDHFFPPNIMRIPEARRTEITVLFQTTTDRKLVDWCTAKGFAEVIELEDGRWRSDALPNAEVMCHSFGNDDSWLALRHDGQLLLNLNDCVIRDHHDLVRIRRLLGEDELTVLLSQFSYANWIGNPDEVERRQRSAGEKVERLRRQLEHLQPRWFIPFASHVWFCHEENHYLNDAVNRVDRVVATLTDDRDVGPVVLLPTESWVVGEAHDSTAAMAAYVEALASVGDRELVTSDEVAREDLEVAAVEFAVRLKEDNRGIVWGHRALRRAIGPLTFRIWDLDVVLTLNLDTGALSDAGDTSADIELGSDSLAFLLRNRWGGDTLLVNGRFRTTDTGRFPAFEELCLVTSANNHGWSYGTMRRQRLRGFIRYVWEKRILRRA